MANGIFPHPSKRPWPPPLDFDGLLALRGALLDRDDPRHADQVPASERAAFEVAPLDWCVRHPEPGRALVTRAVARLKEPAPRRKPRLGG